MKMKLQSVNKTLLLEISECEFEVDVTFHYRPMDPGCNSGLPEKCWPTEPAEVEIIKIEYYESNGKITDISCLLDNLCFCEWVEVEMLQLMESEE